MTLVDHNVTPLEPTAPLNSDPVAVPATAESSPAFPKSALRRRTLAGLGAAFIPAAVPSGFAGLAGLTGLTASAVAQDTAASYPAKPIRLVVGYAPGGPTDIIARILATKMQEQWGQPVVVENRPGAGSNLAAEAVQRADPDGYTLLIGTIANANNMSLYKNVKYDIQRDFVAVSQVMSAPSVLVVSPSLPVQDLKELVAMAKAKPGVLTYASSGAGGSPHLAGELFCLRADVRMVHVPYKGGAPALADVISGQVNLGFKTALTAVPAIKSGRLRPIAVAANKRLAQLPEVPTLAELGIPDLEVSSWNGVFAPARTPTPVVNKLAQEVARVVALPDVRERLLTQAAEPVGSSPEEFRAYVRSEVERWGQVARAAKISLD
jgi:tripartite-type tricarboxylate transporter receptor subunit TctC